MGQAGTTAALDGGSSYRTRRHVQTGQGYYIKVLSAGGPGPIGGYGLLVNFTSNPQPAIAPPNTTVPQQAAGPAPHRTKSPTGIPLTDDLLVAIGNLIGMADEYLMPGAEIGSEVTGLLTQTATNINVLEAVVVSIAGASSSSADTNPVQLLDQAALALINPAGTGPARSVLQAVDQSIDDGDLL